MTLAKRRAGAPSTSRDAMADPKRGLRPRLRWWGEAVFVVVCYETYEFVRAKVAGSQANAYAHADQVYRLEKATRLLVEKHVQDAFVSHPIFLQILDVYYGTVHFFMPIIALVVLWRLSPERYVRMRRTIFALTLAGLAVFATWPLAPPRYWPTFTHPFVIDTGVRYGGMGPFDSGGMKDFSNLWAAMPSLHIGWSTWCALALFPLLWSTGRRVWAMLTLIDPVMTWIAVLATGNHWVVDGLAGIVMLGVAYAGAVAFEQRAGRAERRSELGEPRPAEAEAARSEVVIS